MNRPHYSEFVRHCLRFYSRNLHLKQFKSDIDKQNWIACDDVIRSYCDRDRDIIVMTYGEFDTLSDNVYNTARKLGIHQAIIWDMMKDLERKIAKRRGLIV